MNLEVRLDKNGTLYITDDIGSIAENVLEIKAETKWENGLMVNTHTVILSDCFGKIEPQ